MKNSPCDINGKRVNLGTRVKLLSISKSLLLKLPEDEVEELKTMIGKTFEVYEIDECGRMWVQQEFNGLTENHLGSHHLNLESHEMEIIE